MPKTEKHLIDKIVNRKFLENSADEAMAAVKNKKARYLLKFIKNRKECIDMIQNMIILMAFPKKEYNSREILNGDKYRVIDILPFFPWSILLHAIKNALEPIVDRVTIYDSSAGMKGKGQVFAALRVRMFIRRYKEFTHIVVIDLRKFYQSIPHALALEAVGRYVSDPLFMEMFKRVILDYLSDIEGNLSEEREKKLAHCNWAENIEPPYIDERGVTIGGSVSQLIGNLALKKVDHWAKRVMKLKAYHRHCDDIFIGARSQEEGEMILREFDRVFTEMGLVMKHTSFVAPLEDVEKGIKGRRLDFCGYVYSRSGMRMRKRTKQRFARKLHNVESKRRRREIVAAYWGIAKWGRCRNLMNTILKQEGIMSFSDLGITTSLIKTDKNGKRIFDVPEVKIGDLAKNNTEIVIYDFETGITMKGNDGRCVVLFTYKGSDEYKKFITTSERIIDKLNRARAMENDDFKAFPQPTRVLISILGNGRFSYDID